MKKDERGSAMIIVLCVMAVTVVLALVLLHTAAMVSRGFGKINQKEQCRILAVSVSECLTEVLEEMEYTAKEDAGKNGESEAEDDFESEAEDDFELENDLEPESEGKWHPFPESEMKAEEWTPQTKFQRLLEEAAVRGRKKLTLQLKESAGLPGTTTAVLELKLEAEASFPEEVLLILKVTTVIEDDSYTVVSHFRFGERETAEAAEDRETAETAEEKETAEAAEESGKMAETGERDEMIETEESREADGAEKQKDGGTDRDEEEETEKERRTGHWKYQGRGMDTGGGRDIHD